ncbi:hypothetical protein DCAR_0205853 [Daucus carota subsp. sativus]|uniref:Bulb-type lectin domain-containing protein n=1 Tax=Daucus carota subsp. sativus TaxID=79200 RepID=A0AAF0WD58_DAUCS|nr:hypothetical protein DCAR_0205853 [Daucus carota subsp. sativus]
MAEYHINSNINLKTMRWVWDANRAKPVQEKATLNFGMDGNLILAVADADGTVAWQTDTANKDVVILCCFDHPTDTLLPGQSLLSTGPNKLISRLSDTEASDGPYSYVLEKSQMSLYYKPNNTKTPILCNKNEFGTGKDILIVNCEFISFNCSFLSIRALLVDNFLSSSSHIAACGEGAVDYYKVVGVEHFSSGGTGPTAVGDCRKKCDSDCKCLISFYWEESSTCFIAPSLGALNKVISSLTLHTLRSPS